MWMVDTCLHANKYSLLLLNSKDTCTNMYASTNGSKICIIIRVRVWHTMKPSEYKSYKHMKKLEEFEMLKITE